MFDKTILEILFALIFLFLLAGLAGIIAAEYQEKQQE